MMKWILRTNDFKVATINGNVIKSTKNELLKAGFKKLGLFWGLALVCLPFPGLHFILVPFFFFFGIWSFFKVQKNSLILKSGSYECPGCQFSHQIAEIFVNHGDKWRCNQCGTQMVLISEN